MTQPAGQPTVEQIDAQADETLAYERGVEGAVAAGLAIDVAVALAGIWAAFETLEHAGRAPGQVDRLISALVARKLAAIDPDMRPELNRRIAEGMKLGAQHARELSGLPRGGRATVTDTALWHVVERVDERAGRRLSEAIAMAHNNSMAARTNVQLVMAKARQAVTSAEGDSRWVANRAVNAGAAAVAAQHGWDLLWVAERDACLHCLAYSGHVTTPGHPFPGGLTYAAKPLKISFPLLYPPLHPNCRCRVTPWSGSTDELPAAFQREARRSVVRGDSAYDSERARLGAADRLLQRGAALPKSVIERGRRAVSAGRFETPADRRRRSSH